MNKYLAWAVRLVIVAAVIFVGLVIENFFDGHQLLEIHLSHIFEYLVHIVVCVVCCMVLHKPITKCGTGCNDH